MKLLELGEGVEARYSGQAIGLDGEDAEVGEIIETLRTDKSLRQKMNARPDTSASNMDQERRYRNTDLYLGNFVLAEPKLL